MTVRGLHGMKYRLNPVPIGSDDEGNFHSVDGMGYIVKIYKAGALSPEFEEQLKDMIANPPNASELSHVAWPLDIAHDRHGRCRGFVMPNLDFNEEPEEVYEHPPRMPTYVYQSPSLPLARKKAKGWKYVLASVVGIAAVLALVLQIALPDGLYGFFNPHQPELIAINQEASNVPQDTLMPPQDNLTPSPQPAPQDSPTPSPQPALQDMPTPTPPQDIPTPSPQPAPQLVVDAQIGDIIRFGPYDWRVLDVQGGMKLVITDKIIDRRGYHSTADVVTWETSDMRQWLNGEFLDRFSQQEQAHIATTTVVNRNNQWFGTIGGNDTQDRVFLLSIEEVVLYFGDSRRLANRPRDGWFIVDEFSDARAALYLDGWGTAWLLRSPGLSSHRATSVRANGDVGMNGSAVSLLYGVRPAMWLTP